MPASSTNSRVIVVGGGPVGLTAAHALSQAGIDFVLLERRNDTVYDAGASLVLFPQGLRALGQLGLLPQLEAIGSPLKDIYRKTLDGRPISEMHGGKILKQNHGSYSRTYYRVQLLELLYNELPAAAKAKILTNKKVTTIASDERGVQVACADGTTYAGSVVLGADGVHSAVRRQMRSLALAAGSPADAVNEAAPYLSTYRALWCTFPRQPGFGATESFESHGHDVSVQNLNSEERSWMFIYEKLDQPTKERADYGDADIEDLLRRRGDLMVGPDFRVRDVVATGQWKAGMANLEEGIVQHWSWGRIALAGDACHKFTPNNGLGYNNGIQDVVAFVNELHHVVAEGEPSMPALTAAFERYQTSRSELLAGDFGLSAMMTRMSAWATNKNWLMDRWVMPMIPYLDRLLVNYVMSPPISKTPAFDFIEGPEPFEGRIPWVNAVKKPVPMVEAAA